MYTEEDAQIVDAMAYYGGSFVKSLAACFYRADATNFAKLKRAFPEYWEEYRQMVSDMQKEKEKS